MIETNAADRAATALSALAGHLNLLHARLTAEMVDILADEAWKVGGKRTPTEYLVWKLGLSSAAAKGVVQIAERRELFPNLVALFDEGQLSLDQMAAAVEAPPYADAQEWGHFCRISTVPKIRRALRSNLFTGDPDDPDEEPPAARDRVSFGVGRDGRWRLSANLGIDDGRRVEAALTEARDALFTDANHEDFNEQVAPAEQDDQGEPAGRATWPGALVEVAERSLDAVESPSRRDRFRTWLHLDVSEGSATTTDGWRIPMDISDRLLCDGVVQPVWESEGVPFSVGRAQHIVPDRTRRIVELRDRGCRVPGCSGHVVEIHHIIHWMNGGRTDTCNLICLCPAHHRLHHLGQLGISGDADAFDGVIFTDANGKRIGARGDPVVPADPPPAPSERYRNPINGRMNWSWLSGWEHPNATRQRIEEIQRRRTLRQAA